MDRETKRTDKSKLKILVAGGRLQGTEIIYLAKKAGYDVTLVDRSSEAPAAGLADRFIQGDIFDADQMRTVLQDIDVVIPAIEDIELLDRLGQYCREMGVTYIFDKDAYSVSCSKNKTNQLLSNLKVPIPEAFPACGYPVICKPDASSGSRGVVKVESEEAFQRLMQEYREEGALSETDADPSGHGFVVQQYLDGPSYSLEVLGNGEEAIYPMVTEVVVDQGYDCKRIIAPADISKAHKEKFLEIAKEINKILKIRGIFDIEVVLNKNELYVLEIDARFPSQTPISIYHASGMNFVEILIALANGEHASGVIKPQNIPSEKACTYQQIWVKGNRLKVRGEHIMSDAGKLQLLSGFCKADEMLTDYIPGADSWKAIVILTGTDMQEVERKWQECICEIAALQGVEKMDYIEG